MFGYQQQPPVDPGTSFTGQRQPPEQKVDANGVPYYEDNSRVGNPMNPMAQSRMAGYMEQRAQQQRQQAMAAWMARREQATGQLPEGTPAYIGGYQSPAQNNFGPNAAASEGALQPGFRGQSAFDVPAQRLNFTQAGQNSPGVRQSIRGAGPGVSPFGQSATPRAGTAYY